MSSTLTVEFSDDAANGVVYAIGMALVGEAETLSHLDVSTTPGDLRMLAQSSERITELAEVNKQLEWRAHWGPITSPSPAITAATAVWLDVAAELHERAEEQRRHGPDEFYGSFEFDEAARTIARVYAGEAVTA